MLSELTNEVIDYMLTNQRFGRIGCAAANRVLIEPVMYHYDGYSIYGYTREGTKTHLLRKNPHVGFEIDEVVSPGVWRSVVIEGLYEELQGDERAYAIYIMGLRKLPLFEGERLATREETNVEDAKVVRPVVYRIQVRHKSGRCIRL